MILKPDTAIGAEQLLPPVINAVFGIGLIVLRWPLAGALFRKVRWNE